MYRVSYSVKIVNMNKFIIDKTVDFKTFREAIDFVHKIRVSKNNEMILVGKPLVEKLVKGKVA